MQNTESNPDDRLGPIELRKLVPFEPFAASDRLGWVGLEAAHYNAAPSSEIDLSPLTHHALVLITRPPEKLELLYAGVKRHRPPAAGLIFVVPAGTPALWRWTGPKDSLHVYLEPDFVARIAAEAFGLDAARISIPPLDALESDQFRAVLGAIEAELVSGGAGGRLAAESLANILGVDLIRYLLTPRRAQRGRDSALPRSKLRAVVEYIEEHLDANPTLAQLATVAGLSSFHFARQFKVATGMPPHEYVIARRVERARGLLQSPGSRSLAELAAKVGFSDQSQFSRHFKRLVGVTPGQFRRSARIA